MRGHFVEKLKAKLRCTRGETLVETLASTLILSVVVLMLCTAIVAAAKANTAIDVHNTSVNVTAQDAEAPQALPAWKVTVSHDLAAPSEADVTVYSQNGYVYYAPVKSNE